MTIHKGAPSVARQAVIMASGPSPALRSIRSMASGACASFAVSTNRWMASAAYRRQARAGEGRLVIRDVRGVRARAEFRERALLDVLVKARAAVVVRGRIAAGRSGSPRRTPGTARLRSPDQKPPPTPVLISGWGSAARHAAATAICSGSVS